MNRASIVLHPLPYPPPPPLGVTEGARRSLTAKRRAPDHRHHGAGGHVDEGASSASVVQAGPGETEDDRC